MGHGPGKFFLESPIFFVLDGGRVHPSAFNADQGELMNAGWRGPKPDEFQRVVPAQCPLSLGVARGSHPQNYLHGWFKRFP
jgi:hypothetical protein